MSSAQGENSEASVMEASGPVDWSQRPGVTLIPLDHPSLDWEDFSTLKFLTCVNHPTAEFLTKNPWERHIHVTGEVNCKCPLSDLRGIWSAPSESEN